MKRGDSGTMFVTKAQSTPSHARVEIITWTTMKSVVICVEQISKWLMLIPKSLIIDKNCDRRW